MLVTDYRKSRSNHMWVVWSHMLQRCMNKNAKDYKFYGAKGIKVCERWADFRNFVDDMLVTYKSGLTLDRKDNSLGYSPDNCRWITHKEQCNNRVSNVIIVNPETGESFTGQQLSERYGVKRGTIFSRMMRGNSRFDQLTHKGHLKTYNFQKGY